MEEGHHDKYLALEEYKDLKEEVRFLISRYLHAVLAYIAISGFLFVNIVSYSNKISYYYGLITIAQILTIGSIYGTIHFRGMIVHHYTRIHVLAEKLGYQRQYSLTWVYILMGFVFSVFELFIVILFIDRVL